MSKQIKSEKFENLITKENIAARIEQAVEKIKAAYVSEPSIKYIEDKYASMGLDDQKKNEYIEKTKLFLSEMAKGLNHEIFRNQITATINDPEKIDALDENDLLKTIENIETEMTTKINEFLDNTVRMIFEIERRQSESSRTDASVVSDAEFEKQKQLANEYLNALQRMKADFDNYKKRVIREKEEYKILALENLFTDMLSVLDSFDSIKPDSKIDFEGIQKINKLLVSICEKHNLKEVESSGVFDPNIHQALTSEQREDVEDNTITESFRKGYKLGEKLIRPALVKVSVNDKAGDAPDNKASEN